MRKLAMSPAFVAALVIEALLVFLDVAGELTPQTWEWFARWGVIRIAGMWAASLLFAAGWADLARRATGPTRRLLWLLSLASWTRIAIFAAHEVVGAALLDPDRLHRIFSYVYLAELAIFVGASVVVTLVAQSWRSSRRLALVAVVVPLNIAAMRAIPSARDGLAMALVLGALTLVHLLAQGVLLERATHAVRAAEPSNGEASAGFTLPGRALRVRLGFALVLAFCCGAPSERLASLVPLANGIMLLAVGWGVLRASHSGIVGLSRARLVAGSALTAGWAAFQVYQGAMVWPIEVPLTVAGPLLGLTGLGLIVWAAVAFASSCRDDSLQIQAWFFGTLIVIGLLASISGGVSSAYAAIVAVANLFGVIVLAIICGQLAKRLWQAQNVPAARVR